MTEGQELVDLTGGAESWGNSCKIARWNLIEKNLVTFNTFMSRN